MAQDWKGARDRAFERVMREHRVPPRRARVARGVLRGYPDKDIAVDMGVSVHAVKKHKQSLYRQFRVLDRGGLAKTVRFLMGDDDTPQARSIHFGE